MVVHRESDSMLLLLKREHVVIGSRVGSWSGKPVLVPLVGFATSATATAGAGAAAPSKRWLFMSASVNDEADATKNTIHIDRDLITCIGNMVFRFYNIFLFRWKKIFVG